MLPVDVAANAVAKAVKDGDGEAVAEAIATSIKEKCKKGTKKGNCPVDRATKCKLEQFGFHLCPYLILYFAFCTVLV